MNKKYLSVILFSALMLGTAGTVTSCKDYDDDIANLQEQIDQKASQEELQNQIATLQADVDAAKADAEAALQAAQEAKATAEEALEKAGSGSAGLDQEAIAALIEAAKADLEKAIEDIETQMDRLASLEYVQGEIDALEAKIAACVSQEALEALADDVDALTTKIASIIGNLLNSLVYQPNLYINGIEATEYPWMQYTKLAGTTAASTNFTDNEGTNCVVTTAAAEWNYRANGAGEYDPEIFVDYNINPSSAKVTKAELSLISNDAEVVNTRASEATPQIGTANDIKLQNGVLSVPVVADGSEILTQPEAANTTVPTLSKASIFALQANVKTDAGEDRVVTSDWAALYSSIITPQTIAYSVENYNGYNINARTCSVAANPDELWPSVQEAIENVPTLRVAYDDQVGIDLSKVLAIHYNHASLTSTNGTHKVWAWGQEAQYGLKYDFALIHYNAGTNRTSDSKYVDQDAIKNGIVIPRIVDAQGETMSEQGTSSIGRHPLVRVRVLDASNNVVLHAYIKVEIIQMVGNIVTDVFDKDNSKFDCDGDEIRLTWSEVSNQLIEKVELSKEEFQQLYRVDQISTTDAVYTTANELYQFVLGTNDTFSRVATAAAKYGTVTEVYDGQGTTNPVLVWTLNMTEQQRIYELPDHTKTIYVRYVRTTSQPGEANEIAPVYLPIKVTITKPQGTVQKKISEYWYPKTGESALTSTRLNVPYPQDGGNTLNYVVDLNNVWEGNQPTFGMDNTTWSSYTATILSNQTNATGVGGYKYYFTADNNATAANHTDQFGNTYRLFAGTSASTGQVAGATALLGGTKAVTPENVLQYALKSNTGEYLNDALYAEVVSVNETPAPFSRGSKVMIAKIDQNTGFITYENNSVSKRLLNAYDHSVAELYAQIGICAFSPCDVALSLQGATYPAYFLRPLSIEDNNTGEFVDAQANGSIVNIATIFDFEDWRDVAFKDGSNYQNVWLYAFYGLNEVKVQTSLITTDLNGYDLNSKLLSEVTTEVQITQPTATTLNLSAYNRASAGTAATWNAIVAAMGQIKYVNNGNNVGEFNVRIPVDFTYDWGTIRAYVVCHVSNTMGN